MKRNLLSLIIGLVVLLFACNLPSSLGGELTPTPIPPTPIPAVPTDTPEPTALPTSTVVPTVPVSETPVTLPGPDVAYGGVHFTLPPEIAPDATAQQVPAQEDTANLPYWEIYPAHVEISLTNYVLQDTFHQAGIFIYPVAEYEALQPEFASDIGTLQQLLADQPAAPDSIPFLPVFNAAQLFRGQVAYLDFQNGSGVRFLTQYEQNFWPLNNHDMFYAFQGLTSDGAYYVGAILPASAPILPDASDAEATPPEGGIPFPAFDAADFDQQYTQYMADIVQALNALPADAFTPTLTNLDLISTSFQVE